ATRHSPLATRHSPLATTSQDPPPGYCLTPTAELSKSEWGPDLDEQALYLIMRRTGRFLHTNQSVPSHSPPLTR
ncbi:MAG: hypothetical protein ACXWM8_02190, partial [Candidatus Limnocylindrales bacterium]